MDLGALIGRRAAATPRLPAITFDGHTTSYGDLLDQIDTLAAELAAGGVGRGDRVGYLGLNDPIFLITLFAAARIGAVFVPLNYRLTAAELRYILTDAGVHTLLADAEHVAAADPVLTEAGVRRERLPRRSRNSALQSPGDRGSRRARDTARAVGRSGHRRGRAELRCRAHP